MTPFEPTPANYSKIPELTDLQSLFGMSGKTGLVLGGAGKMGRQFAITLANAGAKVLLTDISQEACNLALDEIRPALQKGASIPDTMVCDVSIHSEVVALMSKVGQKWGSLDFLVSNVMGKPPGYYEPFSSYSEETWDQVLKINLSGTFFACQQALPLLKKSTHSSIVITSSIYGFVGPDQRIYKDCDKSRNQYGGGAALNAPASYSASKGGLLGLTKHLATLLASDGIRVNALIPGGVYDGQEEAFHAAYTARVPLQRMAVWSDYNGALLFLVSNASRYMTGANLVVDGGWTAW